MNKQFIEVKHETAQRGNGCANVDDLRRTRRFAGNFVRIMLADRARGSQSATINGRVSDGNRRRWILVASSGLSCNRMTTPSGSPLENRNLPLILQPGSGIFPAGRIPCSWPLLNHDGIVLSRHE